MKSSSPDSLNTDIVRNQSDCRLFKLKCACLTILNAEAQPVDFSTQPGPVSCDWVSFWARHYPPHRLPHPIHRSCDWAVLWMCLLCCRTTWITTVAFPQLTMIADSRQCFQMPLLVSVKWRKMGQPVMC